MSEQRQVPEALAQAAQNPFGDETRCWCLVQEAPSPRCIDSVGAESRCCRVQVSAEQPQDVVYAVHCPSPIKLGGTKSMPASAKCPLLILAIFTLANPWQMLAKVHLLILVNLCESLQNDELQKLAKACQTLQKHICKFARKLAKAC